MSEPRIVNNRRRINQPSLERMGIYSGDVSAAAAITQGPSGWTGAVASSVFTITHTLGLTADSYKVFTTPTGTAEGTATVTTRGANAFTVTGFDLGATPALADIPFQFLMIVDTDED
jgi:hypothetical protein